jgi:hypothetical protein
MTAFRIVDLPAPLAPIIEISSPFSRWKLTPQTHGFAIADMYIVDVKKQRQFLFLRDKPQSPDILLYLWRRSFSDLLAMIQPQ